MHIDRDSLSAKVWLDPDVLLAENYGFNRQELRDIERIAHKHLEVLRHAWDSFCNSDPGSS